MSAFVTTRHEPLDSYLSVLPFAYVNNAIATSAKYIIVCKIRCCSLKVGLVNIGLSTAKQQKKKKEK